MIFRNAGFVIFAVVQVSTASAQIIECTSKDGRRSYAQTCPPDTMKEREVAGSSATKPLASPPANVESKKTTNEIELEFQRRKIAREQETDKADKQEQANKSKCVELMRRIDVYETAGRISRTDPATGKKTYIEDDQRTATLAQLRSDAKQCR